MTKPGAVDEAATAALRISLDQPDLLTRALTHRSAAPHASNQRLEFLGDRVFGLVIADRLYARFPNEEEGSLARRLAALVSTVTLAEVARGIELGRHLIMAESEAAAGGRRNTGTLADACEAVIGALYLDGGLDHAAAFIDREWGPLIDAQREPPRDAKTTLQEWTQARGQGLPDYAVIAQSGPDHSPTFEVRVRIDGVGSASGLGRSKQAAAHAAAEVLLDTIAQTGDG